jgi:hypothetical protein
MDCLEFGVAAGRIISRLEPPAVGKKQTPPIWAALDELRMNPVRRFSGTCELPGAANGLGLLAGLLFGRLLVVVAELHFAEDTLPLELLLQGAQRLIHIVIANNYLQAEPPLDSSDLLRKRPQTMRAPTGKPVTVGRVYS